MSRMRRVAMSILFAVLPFAAVAISSRNVSAESPANGKSRSNVLFIAVDDMGTKLGSYGFDAVKTPQLRRLAKRGVLFERAYCNYPVCNASRTSLLSGRRPGTRIEPKKIRWLPEQFQQHDYFTAEIGKVSHAFGATQSIEWDLSEHEPHWPGRDSDEERFLDGRTARRTIQVMEQHRDEPFFIAVGFQKPHIPFRAPEKYHAMYDPDKIVLPQEPADDVADIPPIARANLTNRNRPGKVRLRFIADYYACETFIDAQTGLLLDAVDRLGLADRTVIVFFADHGLHLGEHGGMWGKRSLFEESMQVPLIVAAPGYAKGAKSPRLVELVDLYPTLTDLCGLPVTEGQEGTSFLPLLEEPDRPWKLGAFGIVYRPDGSIGRTVRTERYRYNEWSTPDEAELYDHRNDPHEYVNLADRDAQADTVAEMRKLLKSGWQAAGPSATVSNIENEPRTK